MKTNNAAGLDDITVEQVNHFGPGALTWALDMFYKCVSYNKIPKI